MPDNSHSSNTPGACFLRQDGKRTTTRLTVGKLYCRSADGRKARAAERCWIAAREPTTLEVLISGMGIGGSREQ